MTTRLATLIGLPSDDERALGATDVVAFCEPAVGATSRTKGALYLLAQVAGDDPRVARAAADALDGIEHEYYGHLTGGVPVALRRALSIANRSLHHRRAELGIPARARIGLVALVLHEREAYVARVGPAAVVLVRDGRMYEVPPSPTASDEDPRARRRQVAASAGESRDVEPFAWRGPIAAGDRVALVSRHLARVVGADDLKRALTSHRPAGAVEYLQHLHAARGGGASNGVLALEVIEHQATEPRRVLEPVRPADPLAGLPDRSPVPLADGIGPGLERGRATANAGLRAVRSAVPRLAAVVYAFVPRRRAEFPAGIPRTDDLRDARRRRLGAVGIAAVAAIVAFGATAAGVPGASPVDAIPRATVARDAIGEAAELLAAVDERIGGADLLDRDPDVAGDILASAQSALDVALGAGVPRAELAALLGGVEERRDRLYGVRRIGAPSVVVDLAALLEDIEPTEMVAASDGSLWVMDAGRGRVIRVDPVTGSATVVLRAGSTLPSGATPGDPWLMATAATDVVVVDRERSAWRIDLTELIPRRMALAGVEALSASTTLLAALQHRPPLEIFTLYAVDGETGDVERWTPPPVIPVEYPDPPESYLADVPDLHPAGARDLRVDANAWLLHASTVTRVDFGTPRAQDEYSLDPPPDADLRPHLDYRLIDGATVGDREMLYVYDAGSDRLIAFGRADGAFVGQWMAPGSGPSAGALADVRGLAVASVADGPPVAYLLTAERVVRLVLE